MKGRRRGYSNALKKNQNIQCFFSFQIFSKLVKLQFLIPGLLIFIDFTFIPFYNLHLTSPCSKSFSFLRIKQINNEEKSARVAPTIPSVTGASVRGNPPDPLIPLFRLPLPHLHCKNRRDPGLTRISVRRRHSQTRPRRRLPTQW